MHSAPVPPPSTSPSYSLRDQASQAEELPQLADVASDQRQSRQQRRGVAGVGGLERRRVRKARHLGPQLAQPCRWRLLGRHQTAAQAMRLRRESTTLRNQLLAGTRWPAGIAPKPRKQANKVATARLIGTTGQQPLPGAAVAGHGPGESCRCPPALPANSPLAAAASRCLEGLRERYRMMLRTAVGAAPRLAAYAIWRRELTRQRVSSSGCLALREACCQEGEQVAVLFIRGYGLSRSAAGRRSPMPWVRTRSDPGLWPVGPPPDRADKRGCSRVDCSKNKQVFAQEATGPTALGLTEGCRTGLAVVPPPSRARLPTHPTPHHASQTMHCRAPTAGSEPRATDTHLQPPAKPMAPAGATGRTKTLTVPEAEAPLAILARVQACVLAWNQTLGGRFPPTHARGGPHASV